ncbi:hypothetical protein GMDG_07207 [Pseudogymnoascus destructans 20631-21]|uniref:Uncharacterized protein n=1 Tax=Pseudogymnoascus destructans (strain ATCC MYA-4855 / 20631-21) TaxID=658429 RepID=L8FZM9_PSED2|nr:hypothetical protein GMDG_07207 [Pseudogymnoascus destructans 20631-21]
MSVMSLSTRTRSSFVPVTGHATDSRESALIDLNLILSGSGTVSSPREAILVGLSRAQDFRCLATRASEESSSASVRAAASESAGTARSDGEGEQRRGRQREGGRQRAERVEWFPA